MLNYYDEIKNDILEALEKEENKKLIEQAEDKDDAYYALYDRFYVDDLITGNASGSYYCNAYKARKQCYNFFRDVFEALENYDFKDELENFKIFINLVEENYLNIENMTINYDVLDEVDEDIIFYKFEKIEDLSFETLDVITRCDILGSVLDDVLNSIIK